jgi:hypothetical protein
MLRIERIFEQAGIQEELDAYNPLIPDGGNWKATMMIEYTDPAERAVALGKLRGIEDLCYVESAGGPRVMAIADEDIERENDEKTSAVHWLRFELPASARGAIQAGAAVTIGGSSALPPCRLSLGRDNRIASRRSRLTRPRVLLLESPRRRRSRP